MVDARRSAERAQKAEEAAAATQDRVTGALEAMAFLDGPPWTVEWISGGAYLLTNNAPVAAHDVRASIDADMATVGDLPQGIDIGARSAIKFMDTAHMGTGFQKNTTVTWTNRSGDDLIWTHPLPPSSAAPPRR